MHDVVKSPVRLLKAKTPTSKLAFIGTFPPIRCGIATFTQDMLDAVRHAETGIEASVVAVTPASESCEYSSDVIASIRQHYLADYVKVAALLNECDYGTISLQHEFGIFGGPAGNFILRLVELAEADLVTTLHTVSSQMTADQRRVVDLLLARSKKIVVMAARARDILVDSLGADPDRIAIIPHGVPARTSPDYSICKAQRGFAGRSVLMTFGLIGRGKGLETMIRAMPAIAERHADALYVILGATHPNVIAAEGERYRQELTELAHLLGVESNILFIDKYVSQPELIDYLSCADIYVTPYLNQDQITSGTLAYAYALGRPIVSTPYAHAAELLGQGRGVLCDFDDSAGFAEAINNLLADPERRLTMGLAAHEGGKSMHWPMIGRRYLDLFAGSAGARRSKATIAADPGATNLYRSPHVLTYLDSITDDTGLIQHSTMSVANRAEGYCVDDNARALLAISLHEVAERISPMTKRLENVYVAFVQHSWNGATKRFRNFMSFDRKWLEEAGSEDSHGRTLHALAAASTGLRDPSRRVWAGRLFHEAIASADTFSSPRAIAHTINALCVLKDGGALGADNEARLRAHASFLHSLLRRTATAEWVWFEEALAYENALLPGALINAARTLKDVPMLRDATEALVWLSYAQKSEEGWFRPVGTQSVGVAKSLPSSFDQQPIEAYATIAAYAAAAAADPPGRRWRDRAGQVFAWFTGANDLGSPVLDVSSFACCDGLHAHGPNANQGAESCLSAVLSALVCEAMARTVSNSSPYADPLKPKLASTSANAIAS